MHTHTHNAPVIIHSHSTRTIRVCWRGPDLYMAICESVTARRSSNRTATATASDGPNKVSCTNVCVAHGYERKSTVQFDIHVCVCWRVEWRARLSSSSSSVLPATNVSAMRTRARATEFVGPHFVTETNCCCCSLG